VTTPSPARQRSPWRRWSTWRRIVQALFALWALAVGLRHLILNTGGSIEASCPFGAVETLWARLTQGTFLRALAPSNFLALGLVLLSALLLGRAFCGWVCPVGTLQDLVAGLRRRMLSRADDLALRPPRRLDRVLRWGKVAVLGAILWTSLSAVVPPLAPFCPFRILLGLSFTSLLSWGILLGFFTTSLLVERFWCRYLCPLGALLAPLNRFPPLRPRVNPERCVACGRCAQACPAGIDPVQDGTEHPECVRCFACVEACRRPGAVEFTLRRN
jgi:polyferredoxin